MALMRSSFFCSRLANVFSSSNLRFYKCSGTSPTEFKNGGYMLEMKLTFIVAGQITELKFDNLDFFL